MILELSNSSHLQTKLFVLSDPPIQSVFSDKKLDNAHEISDHQRSVMDDLGLSADTVGASSMFTGEEEVFAFARAVVRRQESVKLLPDFQLTGTRFHRVALRRWEVFGGRRWARGRRKNIQQPRQRQLPDIHVDPNLEQKHTSAHSTKYLSTSWLLHPTVRCSITLSQQHPSARQRVTVGTKQPRRASPLPPTDCKSNKHCAAADKRVSIFLPPQSPSSVVPNRAHRLGFRARSGIS